MSTYDYVNSTGLTYFWGKIKAYVASLMPTKVSDLPNDAGYITGYTETDPTVPSWAKAASKPSYTASEVGADASGTAASAVSTHNSSSTAHSDIRSAIPTNVSDLNNDAGYTTNVGTITGITMNGTSKGTSGVVNLGTVITAHQDISGKLDKSGGTMTGALTLNGGPTNNLHAATKKYVDDRFDNLSLMAEDIGVQDLEYYVGDAENVAEAIVAICDYVGTIETNMGDLASVNSPHFTGRPAAPTAAAGTNDTQIATTAFVTTAIANAGSGDMTKSVYDTDDNGVVDEAEAVSNVGGTGGIEFGLDANGKGQYRAVGASTWIPFLSKNWDAVAFICGNGSARSSASYTVLNRKLWGADPDYFDDPVQIGSSEPAISLICKQAGTYHYSYFARGSNNSNANFRVVKNGTTYETISGAPNAGTDGGNTITLAVGDVVNITARNASNSAAAYSFSLYMFLSST